MNYISDTTIIHKNLGQRVGGKPLSTDDGKNRVSQKLNDKNTQPVVRAPLQIDADDTPMNRETLRLALDLLQRVKPSLNSRYQIHVNHDYNKLQLHLIDAKSGEVIQKIPSNQLLAFYDNIEKLTGLFFEQKV